MKIAMIGPYPPERDGIANYTGSLVSELCNKGFDITIFTKPSNTATDSNVYKTISMNPIHIYKTIQRIVKQNIHIIHLQMAIPYYSISAIIFPPVMFILKLVYGKRIIITIHEIERELQITGIIGVIYYWVLLKSVEVVIVHTERAKSILIKKFITKSNKIKVVPHGFLNSILSTNSGTESLYFGKPEKYILFFGFIHVDKGIDILLKAIKILKNRNILPNKSFQLIIAGDIRHRKSLFGYFEKQDYKYLQSIKSYVSENNLLDTVQFIGSVPDNTVQSLISSSSVVVLPYTSVEQSGVLFQVLSQKIPVIVSDIGGLGETITNTELKFRSKDPVDLADKIIFVMKNQQIVKKMISEYYDKNIFQSIYKNYYSKLYI